MYVKPAENPDEPGTLLRVRIPHTYALLPAEGAQVPDTDMFWLQRVAHGDVVRCDPPAEVVAKSPTLSMTIPPAEPVKSAAPAAAPAPATAPAPVAAPAAPSEAKP